MHRRTASVLAAIVALSGFVFYYAGINYANAFNPYGAALGQLARAESAQTPDEVIYYVKIAKGQLPEIGSVSWWSPEKGDFKTIQAELDDIISRARNVSTLELGDELFNSEMLDMHAKLKGIQETLVA